MVTGCFRLAACAVTATTFLAAPRDGLAQGPDLAVVTPGVHIAVDLSTAEVLVAPQNGLLERTDRGLSYFPLNDAAVDHFVLVADHATLGVPVLFVGEKDGDGVALEFEFQPLVTPPGSGAGSATPTVGDDGETVSVESGGRTVTGRIFKFGGSIDFPDETVIIETDASPDDDESPPLGSPDNDSGLVDSCEGSTTTVYDEVGSHEELVACLSEHDDGSIACLVLIGHGSNGGVHMGGDNDPNLDDPGINPEVGGNENNPVAPTIGTKLKPGAPVVLLACNQFSEGAAWTCENLANTLDRPVIACEGNVTFRDLPGQVLDTWFGEGFWVELLPSAPAWDE